MLKIVAPFLAAALGQLSALAWAAEDFVPPHQPLFQNGDAWAYRQVVAETRKTTVSQLQFNVIYMAQAGALMEVIKGEEGHLVNNSGPQVAHAVAFTVPRTGCMVDLFQKGRPLTDEPCPVLPGMSWRQDTANGAKRNLTTFTLKGLEEVRLPSGTFQAFRVDSVLTVYSGQDAGNSRTNEPKGAKRYCSVWYATQAKVVVKDTCTYQNEGALLVTTSHELTAYTVH